ncbi:isoprenylcysteine carboxylmethyltransferase family protein [Saccharopolyspora sp. SCSIO 74807]|uniref:methyltransferase family protein n=1 Tax=Saccharopolyspora sp. SCSIO 74807 TaxID=3118084 RepID=UPI0030D403FB
MLQLAGILTPIGAVDGPLAHGAGLVMAVIGIAATLAAQQNMGHSWRVGVDHAETTTLVTSGAFALVRNPVFTAMITTGAGLALLAPNPLEVTALAALVLAIEIQVRVVEEPYLLATHGHAYRNYATRAGRFLPGLGRLTPTPVRYPTGSR